MNYLGLGDLAISAQARRQNATLRGELTRLTAELSSGQKADVSQVTRGHMAPVASIERSLTLNEAFSGVATKEGLRLELANTSLGSISSSLDGLGASMLGAANAGPMQSGAIIAGAADKFASAVSALSVQAAGEYVFSGIAGRQSPLAEVQVMLDELELATSGATNAIDFQGRVLAWFNDPGGFDVSGYLGAEPPTGSVSVSSTDEFLFDATANSEEIRDVLAHLATIALIDRGLFGGSDEEQVELTKLTAEGVLSASDKFIGLQSRVGEAQQEIVRAKTQNESERYMLSSARNELLATNPFDVATRLEEVQLQLESFYLITAKTSRLNLAEYLR